MKNNFMNHQKKLFCFLLSVLLAFSLPSAVLADSPQPVTAASESSEMLKKASKPVSAKERSKEESSKLLSTEEQVAEESSEPLSAKEQTIEKSSEVLSAKEQTSEKSSELLSTEELTTEKSSELLSTEEQTTEESSELLSTEELTTEESSELLSTEELTTEKSSELLSTEELTTEESSELLSTEELTTEESSELLSTEEQTTEESSEFLSTEEETAETSQEFSTEEESAGKALKSRNLDQAELDALSLEKAVKYASISSCEISSPNQVTVQFSLSQNISSKDGKLYLFALDTFDTSIKDKAPVASINMPSGLSKISITASLDQNTISSKLYSKFVICSSGELYDYVPISEACYITNPEAIAPYQHPFPASASKKGLLINGGMFSDVDELGVRHALVNIELHRLLANGSQAYTYNGTTYYLNSAVISEYDALLSSLASDNIVTTCVLLARPIAEYPELTHPGAANSYNSTFQGLNTDTKKGVACVTAVTHFLAERYGRTDKAHGQIVNWIVGNEVNNPSAWNDIGPADFDSYAKSYARSLRMVSGAIKSASSCSRIYISLDHYWNSTEGGRYNTVSLLNEIQTFLNSEGAIPWEIAHHPYPTPLTNPDFTDDPVSQGQDAIAVTFKNLHVLTDFLQNASMRNPDGGVKHVILSEQGFTSVNEYGQNVSEKQAAMFSYAYYIIDTNPYIDALILNRHVDHPAEVSQNINFGLWETDLAGSSQEKPTKKKEIWEIYKYIDTSQSLAVTAPILTQLGADSWESLIHGFQSESYAGLHSVLTGYLTPATSFSDSTPVSNDWNAQFYTGIKSRLSNGVEVTISPTYSAAYKCILQRFSKPLDFTSKPILGLSITARDLPSDIAKIRVRMFSGDNVYDGEALVVAGQKTDLSLDVSNWAYKNSVDRIQIWAKQQGEKEWNSGSFLLEDVVQASSSSNLPTLTVSNAQADNPSNNSYRVTCDVYSSEEISEVVFQTWNNEIGEINSVLDQKTVRGQSASCKIDVSAITGGSQTYTTKIVAYNKSGAESDPVYVVTQLGKPVLSSVMITNLSSEGYNLTCNATSNTGIVRASCPTWTDKNGQDDLIWHQASVSGSLITCRINISNHNNERGSYYSHIYAYDKNGTMSKTESTIWVPDPSGPYISNIRVTEQDSTGYTVVCKVGAYYGLSRIQFPVWTEKDGQDDIVWHEGTINGDTATVRIPVSGHKNEFGRYLTHIYLYDQKGNQAVSGFTTTVTKPETKPVVVESVAFKDVTEKGYQMVVTLNTGSPVTKASFATWTDKNWQDDLLWETASVKNNTITYQVSTSKHNKESGLYYTHIYLDLENGQTVKKETTITVPTLPADQKPTISNLKAFDITASGYSVTADVSAPAGLDQITCATWTSDKGQDDIIWTTLPVTNHTIRYQVKSSDHKNEGGIYNTHIYVYDKNGDYAMDGVSVTLPAASASLSFCAHVADIGWQNWKSDGFIGTTGKGRRIEAIRIRLDPGALGGGIEYCAHVQNIGWQDWVSNGEMAGTTGKKLRMEAVRIRLNKELSKQYNIEYRAHVQNIGWQGWVSNGEMAGTTGKNLRMEALEIRLVKK